MKKFFSINHDQAAIDIAILIGRVAIAALMLVHGLPKLATAFSGQEIKFPGVFGMNPGFSLALAVFAEVICSVFILVGFGTRLATIPLIITMLIAVFYIHAGDPFAKQEMGLHYLMAYILLLIAGSGKYSVDSLLQHKKFAPAFNGNIIRDDVAIYK